ncbi:MAG: RNA polymerase sigma factor [Oscillospiraceae bacterium]|nr:RNA polymerase sigma factor [Oscillospiraceae bacterium]
MSEFERLLAECRGAVERFVYYKTPTKADGEDVLQEVLLAAFTRFDALRDRSSFKSWLLRIAANKCNDFYRARAKRDEISLDALSDAELVQSADGIAERDAVLETLGSLGERDREMLTLYYLRDTPQKGIADRLGIPVGTVKSRLFAAKRSFMEKYPKPPKPKGETSIIKTKKLPEILPDYTITRSDAPPFAVKCEELLGWFIVPKLGEKLNWAAYDMPERKITEYVEMEVTGRAVVHGIEGVSITASQAVYNDDEWRVKNGGGRSFVAQLTDTHVRFLAESHMRGDVRLYHTFLDGDTFLPNWGVGEDNCGKAINLAPDATSGRYTVEILGKTYDTVCVVDDEDYNSGHYSEQYLDANGRTVLWRKFVRDGAITRFNKPWSELLPRNEKRQINGKTYVHYYDCITDYIL